jgi:riboflavin synthase
MFSGIVEALGEVSQWEPRGPGVRLAIRATEITDDVAIGDSVAVNGCCLTVVEKNGSGWHFDAGAETLSRTNLGRLSLGSPVNLERSLVVGSRLGGHFVTGHVDCVGTLDQRDDEGDWSMFWIAVPGNWTRHMASKGSVTLDGVSLTLVDIEPNRFSIALIPHTLEVTTLGKLKLGGHINIETDVLAKYVERLLLTTDNVND